MSVPPNAEHIEARCVDLRREVAEFHAEALPVTETEVLVKQAEFDNLVRLTDTLLSVIESYQSTLFSK